MSKRDERFFGGLFSEGLFNEEGIEEFLTPGQLEDCVADPCFSDDKLVPLFLRNAKTPESVMYEAAVTSLLLLRPQAYLDFCDRAQISLDPEPDDNSL